ncbi:MAG: phosphoglycerate dehydrogenase, partial [Planctomycetes bacterium]|nr:phosphoglycerate dehydrogenase [Planctomycetota bacterium]
MRRILVADKIAEAGIERLRSMPEVKFDVRHGLSPSELADAIGEYDGVLIRSAVKITKDTLVRPGKLSVIARAGVGVDNVDVDAATAAGVLVLNTPDANTISTAEHTITLMLALHHRIADAHGHVISGGWSRAAYEGEQLAGRTLGIIGLGRIGRAVAQRALGLEMTVIAYDPFVSGDSALNGAVRLVRSVPEILREADVVTLHTTLSSETKHMIGPEQLAMMKRGAKIVNCARGSLIDEKALADALNSERIAGAALDVFENEPPKGSPLMTAKNVLLTPHLAASTSEAQLRVSIDAVDAILAYLLRGEVRSAVNVSGMPTNIDARGRAFFDLCTRMGTVLSAWSAEGIEKIVLTAYGETLREIASTLAWQAMAAIIGPRLDVRLNLVNAREQAKKRGIVVEHVCHSEDRERYESIAISIHSKDRSHQIEGTVYSDRRPRILSIDGYRMDLVPERTMVLIFNDDRPGVIGLVGQTLGNAGINIADMALSRRGKTALMALKLDVPMPTELAQSLSQMEPILSVRSVTLPPVSGESAG